MAILLGLHPGLPVLRGVVALGNRFLWLWRRRISAPLKHKGRHKRNRPPTALPVQNSIMRHLDEGHIFVGSNVHVLHLIAKHAK